MNSTIARLSLRSLFGQKRGLVVIGLPVLLVVLAGVVQLLTDGTGALVPITVVFGMGLVLPLVALLVTNRVLGPEIDDGSIVYLLAKPVSRLVVAVSKLAVAIGVTVVVGAGALLVAGLILDPSRPSRALAVAVGATVAGAAYCAVFVALSAINRHGMVAGLLYVLAFEGLLATVLSGLRYLSVGAFGQRITAAIDDSLDLATNMGMGYAVGASVLVVAAGAYLAGQRLRSFQLRGDE